MIWSDIYDNIYVGSTKGGGFVAYILTALVAYLMGCSNMALCLAKLKNVDIRDGGSGNPGTSNATLLMGWRAGVLVGIHDIGKGVLAVLLTNLLFPELEYGGVVAGVACVLGHIFPVLLQADEAALGLLPLEPVHFPSPQLSE